MLKATDLPTLRNIRHELVIKNQHTNVLNSELLKFDLMLIFKQMKDNWTLLLHAVFEILSRDERFQLIRYLFKQF